MYWTGLSLLKEVICVTDHCKYCDDIGKRKADLVKHIHGCHVQLPRHCLSTDTSVVPTLILY